MEFLRFRDDLTEAGSDVVIFASSHPTGQQLNVMSGGIAAMLKYAVVRAAEDGFDAPFDGTP
jgi:stalled ribosome rescue protein Dom34